MWINSREYDRLLAALDSAEQRAVDAEDALATERAANREAERHFADMILRKAGSFPLPKKVDQPEIPPEVDTSEVPGMDPGELKALVMVGNEFGRSRADVIRELRRERGLE